MTAPRPQTPSRRPASLAQATVAPGFVHGMLAGLRRQGHDPATLLARLNIDLAEPATRIPVDRYAALYNALTAELGDEGFALFAQPMRPGSFEFLCRSCLSARTLAEALTRASRFLALVLPDLAVDIHRDSQGATLAIRETRPLAEQPDDPGRVFAFEWLLRLLHALSCWLAARGIALDAVDFPYAQPPHADDYRLIFTEHSRFSPALPGTLHASFAANLLELPVRRDEAALHRFLDGAPGRITSLYRRDRETVSQVRELLRADLPATPGLDEIAARLHLSPRTLHRRLADEGASFRTVKEALRRDLALARLGQGREPVARIAAELGYADPSAFYRACLDWTGLSPRDYRRRGTGH